MHRVVGMSTQHRYGVRTATLLVVASMIGTGVFTTTGLLLADVRSIGAVLAVWTAAALALDRRPRPAGRLPPLLRRLAGLILVALANRAAALPGAAR